MIALTISRDLVDVRFIVNLVGTHIITGVNKNWTLGYLIKNLSGKLGSRPAQKKVAKRLHEGKFFIETIANEKWEYYIDGKKMNLIYTPKCQPDSLAAKSGRGGSYRMADLERGQENLTFYRRYYARCFHELTDFDFSGTRVIHCYLPEQPEYHSTNIALQNAVIRYWSGGDEIVV